MRLSRLRQECTATAVAVVLGTAFSLVNCYDSTAPEQPPIQFLQPSGGETFRSRDTVAIRVGFRRETISAVYVTFSKDSGRTFSFITADREASASTDYYYDLYRWVPYDDSVGNAEIILKAYDYERPNTFVVLRIGTELR